MAGCDWGSPDPPFGEPKRRYTMGGGHDKKNIADLLIFLTLSINHNNKLQFGTIKEPIREHPNVKAPKHLRWPGGMRVAIEYVAWLFCGPARQVNLPGESTRPTCQGKQLGQEGKTDRERYCARAARAS